MSPATTCPCESPNHLTMGQADGWRQCKGCGRILAVDGEERYPLSDELIVMLRTGYIMRQPGGGVSRAAWLVVGHGATPAAGKNPGYDWSYHEENGLSGAERSGKGFFERGATHVEIWSTAESGLSALVDTQRAPWSVKLEGGRRQRPSGLAAGRLVPALA